MAEIDWTGQNPPGNDPPPPPNPITTQPVPGGRTDLPTPTPMPTPSPNPTATTNGGSFGNPTYDQIANYFRTTSGGAYTPTQQDVSQWGTNIDPQYFNTIAGAISRWWQDYSRQNPTTQTPPTTTTTTTTTGTEGWPTGLDKRIADLYRRYGVTPGERGSGAADWQYWQNEALRNASGDWGYVLSRIEDQLKNGGGSSGGGGTPTAQDYSWEQAVQLANQAAGRTLSSTDINTLLSRYGGTVGGRVTQAGLAPVLAALRAGGGGTGGTGGGTPPPTTTTTTRTPFQPLAPGLSGTYDQALQILRERYRQYYGTDMTDAQLNALKAQYGFTPDTATTQGTPGTRQTSTKLDPSLSGTGEQALSYINGEAQRILGRTLTDAEVQQAVSMIGYQQGQTVTGAQVNQILGALDTLAPMTGGTAGTPGSSRTYTSNDLNPILQALYNGVATGGTGGGGGGTGGTKTTGGNPGGYTDPSSMIYLDQVMRRLMELRTPVNDPFQNLLTLAGLQRVQGLQGDPYTSAEDAALVAKYRDPLTVARDSARQQASEELSRRGIGPTSGLFSRRMGQIDQGYERGIAQGTNDLAVQAVTEKQRRADESLAILSNLLNVNRSGTDRQNALYDQALTVAKMFPDFDEKRLQDLLGASGEGPNSSGILAQLTQLANLGNNINNTTNQNGQINSALWGQIIGALIGQFT